jgi:hypothetical protein
VPPPPPRSRTLLRSTPATQPATLPRLRPGRQGPRARAPTNSSALTPPSTGTSSHPSLEGDFSASPPRACTPCSDSSPDPFVKLSTLCSRVPAIDSLRAALRAPRVTRLDAALSALAAEVRVACAAAFTLARHCPGTVEDLAEADRSARAADALVTDARSLATVCAPAIRTLTRRFPGRDARVLDALSAVVGPANQAEPGPPMAHPGPEHGPPVKF